MGLLQILRSDLSQITILLVLIMRIHADSCLASALNIIIMMIIIILIVDCCL